MKNVTPPIILARRLSKDGCSPQRLSHTDSRRVTRNTLAGRRIVLLAAALISIAAAAPFPSIAQARDTDGHADLRITTLSNHPHLISGGDALVRIDVPDGTLLQQVRVDLDGADVREHFRPIPGEHALLGLVQGLSLGRNTVTARAGSATTDLVIYDYPRIGPIISGPHQQPFICQTEKFRLPDGSLLGPPLDANCSVSTRVDYVYRPAHGDEFLPLPSTTALPQDVSTTTTLSGATVPFVVRVETGTMNRGIYQNMILHDPTSEPQPSPFSPPRGWNGRLIAMHGSGCTGGWYIQGGAQGANILDTQRLGEGYALFINTLNHPTNSCNAFLAGESAMMGKEHFIETFGVPTFTVSTGCSGGAYTSLQIADAFPGLFDGVHISCTFPDALSIALSALDSRLLTHFFLGENSGGFTEEQMVRVSGHKGLRAWYDLALQASRTDPVPGRDDPIPAGPRGNPYRSAMWNAEVPESVRYHPESNPTGARPTVFDAARNVYGIDPETGFALRPFDNVGVQYGLEALQSGVISPAQFVDLNERIGGYDQDANFIAERTVGDVQALERIYRTGVTLGGGGGLASIPVFNWSNIFDEDDFYHYQWFHFAVRERMQDQNGHADNHVMWRGGPPIGDRSGALNQVIGPRSWDVFIDWVAAYTADLSGDPALTRVLRHRPPAATDGCFTPEETPRFIAERQTFGSEANSRCSELWPSYSFPRREAGGPLHANTLKCRLKPLNPADYRVQFSENEWARLISVFSTGVCDWEKPGVAQRRVEPWSSVGPSPENRIDQ